MLQKSKTCKQCGRRTLHTRHQIFTDGVGCLLTVLTAGTFLILWLPIVVIESAFQPWRCQQCGKRN